MTTNSSFPDSLLGEQIDLSPWFTLKYAIGFGLLIVGVGIFGGPKRCEIKATSGKFRDNSKTLILDGYHHTDDEEPFYVPRDSRLITPARYMEELKLAPIDKTLSLESSPGLPMAGRKALSHGKEYIEAAISYTLWAFTAVQNIKKPPGTLRHLVALMLPDCRCWSHENAPTSKATTFYAFSRIRPRLPNSILLVAIDIYLYRAKRKIVGAAVSKRSMRTLEPTLSSPVDIFLKQLLASPSDPVSITDRTKRLGVDIVGRLSFSYDLHLQTDEANRFLVMPSLWATTAAISTCRPPLYIKSTCALVGHFLYPSWDHFTDLLQTMISIIVTQKKDMKHLDLWTEAMSLTIRGGDIAAAAVGAAFLYLSRNPDFYPS
ncbi:hypothetical protein F4823DRAFT_561941 [Ustulina deusta]|nr:hypothetical protein F4823DRAFT_561941 [Ustulina deusta]